MARPPRLADSQVLELIDDLRGRHARLTGTLLREELRRRHGTPGGVSRIYRLLQRAITDPAPSVAVAVAEAGRPTDVAQLREELQRALHRAELAEHREEHHQARWAREIHELREQVQGLSGASRRLRVIEADLLDRSRELAAAYRRIADLEERALSG